MGLANNSFKSVRHLPQIPGQTAIVSKKSSTAHELRLIINTEFVSYTKGSIHERQTNYRFKK